jgi:Domain of unknown function (DUF6924)
MPSLPVLPDAGSSHLVRTDFASSDAWEQVREQAQDVYAEGGRTQMNTGSVPASCRSATRRLTALAGKQWKLPCPHTVSPPPSCPSRTAFTLSSPEHPILAVDLSGNPGKPAFRCIPSHLWSVENNLNLGNMDWREFADATDDNGIFRGFS